MPAREKLQEFAAWCATHLAGDEKGEAQLFLDRLFQAFGQAGLKEAGATLEFRVAKDAGSTSFADLVWKPVVLIEMKKRGTDLQRHYRQAFDYWTRLVPNRPRYVVLCNFDEFRVYDFDTDLDAPKDTLALTDLPGRWGPHAPGGGLPRRVLPRARQARRAPAGGAAVQPPDAPSSGKGQRLQAHKQRRLARRRKPTQLDCIGA